ncbi:MAG: hypothetical protein CSB15_01040 [Clostridiales bacterium]|nr:MAG: hypothetical protein CSB15_01040 [Clostridiales bacterium]
MNFIRRFRRQYNVPKIIISFFVFFLFLYIIISVCIVGYNKLTHNDWQKVELSNNIYINKTVKGFILTDSFLYKAGSNGIMKGLVKEGKKLKAGEFIADFNVKSTSEIKSKNETSKSKTSVDKIDKEVVKVEIKRYFDDMNLALKSGDTKGAADLKIKLNESLDKLNPSKSKKNNVNSNSKAKIIGNENVKEGDKFSITSIESGIVSFYIDKYNGVLSFKDRRSFNYSEIFEKPIEVKNTSTFADFSSGETLLRLVGTKKWHMFLKVDLKDFDNVYLSSMLELNINGNTFIGKVVDKFNLKNVGIVALELENFNNLDLSKPVVDVTVTAKDIKTILIDRRAVLTKDGKEGVYVKGENGKKVFRQIQVVAKDLNTILDKDGKKTNKELEHIANKWAIVPNVLTVIDKNGNLKTINTVSKDDMVFVK